MADIPLRTAYPFVTAEATVPVPIEVPEDNDNWTVVADLQNTGLPNGRYLVTGGLTFSATSTSKSARLRQVDKGVVGVGVSIETKDVTDILYVPFNTYSDVTDGTFNFQIEAQCEEGQGGGGIDVQYTLLFYERKV